MQFTISRDDKRQPWLLAGCFFFLIACIATLFLSADGENKALSPISVSYIADEGNQLSLADVKKLPANAFQHSSETISLGMADHAYWFVVTLPTSQSAALPYLFEIQYPLLDQIDLWFFSAPASRQPLNQITLGDSLPFAQRPVKHKAFVTPIPSNADGEITAYIRVETQGSIKLPMRIWADTAFIEHSSKLNIASGLLFGILAAMAISNLFFFVTTRNLTFFVYTGYVFSLFMALATLHGYAFEYLWPNNTWLQERAIAIFANATIMFAMFFTNLLLSLPTHSKKVSALVNGLGWLFLGNIIISLLLPYYYLIQIFLLLLIVVVLIVFAVGVWLSIKGAIIARYYALAWLLLLICAFAAALDNLDYYQLKISSSTLLLYGAVAETILLAFVVAMGYASQRDELERAKDITIVKEKEIAAAKDKLLQTEQQAKDDLEYKVQERTLELEITLRELSEANQELERLNTIDPLTGIKNRRHFDKRIVAEGRRSRREQTTLTLVMLDIDHFKKINDNYGHDVGDKCIKFVAQLAKSYVKRPSDDVCRYGGEEFAFILPNTAAEGAVALVEQIRKVIENSSIPADGQDISLTVSAGVASQVIQTEGGEIALLKLADQALYQAKEQGRNKAIESSEM